LSKCACPSTPAHSPAGRRMVSPQTSTHRYTHASLQMRLQEGHRRTVGTRITHELRRKPVDLLPHKLMSQGHTTRGIAYRSPARAQIRKPKHRGWILRRLTIRLHLQLLHGKMRHCEEAKQGRKTENIPGGRRSAWGHPGTPKSGPCPAHVTSATPSARLSQNSHPGHLKPWTQTLLQDWIVPLQLNRLA